MTWREELREQRRARILDAAATVFARRGYQRATMKEIATEAGIAPGTIYLYFANKRDLLLGIADQLITRPVDRQLADVASLSAEDYVAAILRERIRFARQNQPFLQALVTEIWTDQELRVRFFSQVIGPLLGTGARYLQERVAEGKLRPCRIEVVVPAVAGSIVILAAMRALLPNGVLPKLSDDELVDELTRLYLYGLSTGP